MISKYPILLHLTGGLWDAAWFKGFIVNLCLVAIIVFYRLTVRQIRREERIRAEYDKRLSTVEMKALRSQMNPHFIFNCLNSIDYYILKSETEIASDYLNRFSRLIRLILQNSRMNYVNLKEEMEALKLYIELESLRFKGKFFYEISIQKGLKLTRYEVPPMLFQPYVENAIWHGLLHLDQPGMLRISLSQENGFLFCVIEDNGIGRVAARAIRSKSVVKKKSMGMQITEDRIELINRLYEKNASVKITDLNNCEQRPSGTRVELTMPI